MGPALESYVITAKLHVFLWLPSRCLFFVDFMEFWKLLQWSQVMVSCFLAFGSFSLPPALVLEIE